MSSIKIVFAENITFNRGNPPSLLPYIGKNPPTEWHELHTCSLLVMKIIYVVMP